MSDNDDYDILTISIAPMNQNLYVICRCKQNYSVCWKVYSHRLAC